MSEPLQPGAEMRRRGFLDYSDGLPSQYESLVAQGHPDADEYRQAYETFRRAGESLIRRLRRP